VGEYGMDNYVREMLDATMRRHNITEARSVEGYIDYTVVFENGEEEEAFSITENFNGIDELTDKTSNEYCIALRESFEAKLVVVSYVNTTVVKAFEPQSITVTVDLVSSEDKEDE
jgi:hypothetical protein